jgi:hypothetical protein
MMRRFYLNARIRPDGIFGNDRAAVRATADVFEREPAAIAALAKRVRESFDPRGVHNAGRMWADV